MQENNVCLRNLCKNTLSKLPIYFFYKKEYSKHVRVLAVCSTQENNFFKKTIYIFFDEIGYFNTEFVSPQHKKYKLMLSHFKKYTKKKNQQYF